MFSISLGTGLCDGGVMNQVWASSDCKETNQETDVAVYGF